MEAQLLQAEAVLAACLSHNNAQRGQGEAAVGEMLKKKESVPTFLSMLEHSQNPGVRQLASILLRKRVLSHWKRFQAAERGPLKARLLQRAAQEPERLVRLGVAHCIGMLAKAEVASGTWPELFQFLMQCSQSAEVGHREVAVMLLHACSVTIAPHMQQHGAALTDIFARGLKDADQRIRIETLRATGSFLNEVEGGVELAMLSALLPGMFDVVRESFAAGNDEVLMSVFELLSEIIELPTQGKATQMAEIVAFMVQIARTDDCPLKYRQKACELLGECCAYKPKFVKKRGFVQPICEIAMQLLCDARCATTKIEADDDGVLSHVAVGSQLLDAAAVGLPTAAVGVPMLEWIKAQVVDDAGAAPFVVRGAVIALGCLSFGCRDLLRQRIDFVVAVARRCIESRDGPVREAACLAASQFADYLQPEILTHHAVILPLGIELLCDPAPHVREKAAYMVDNFAENLAADILPYAPQLLARLATVIAAPAADAEGHKPREQAVSALSSVAKALGEQFAPFAADALRLLTPLLRLTDDAVLVLRARATEAVGIVANACGRGVFDACCQEVCQLVLQGLELDYSELNEYSFGFWANMAELYKEEWLVQLPQLMPLLMVCYDAKDGEIISGDPFAAVPSTNVGDDDPDHESDSDVSVDGPQYRDRMMTDRKQANAKCSALHCMGIFAKVAGAAFQPWCEEVAKRALAVATSHVDPMIQKNALEVLVYLVMVRYHSMTPPPPRVVGFPSEETLSDPVREALRASLMEMLNVMRQVDDKEVVAVACDCVGQLCTDIGAVAVHNHIDSILGEAVKMMNCQAVCQLVESDDDGDERDGELPEDHEQQLIDGVFDMIDKIAAAYGQGFRPMFDELLPHIRRYLAPDRPESDHFMAIATIGECCKAMEDKIQGHVDDFVALCVAGMQSADGGVRSNSAYTVGVVCQGAAETGVKHYPAVLKGLESIIARAGERPEAVDNAVSAACRLFRVRLDACFPAAVLPALCAHVPLKADMSENENVYATLGWLLEQRADAVAPAALPAVSAAVRGLLHPTTQPEIRLQLGSLMQNLFSGAGAARYRPLLPQLAPELQQGLKGHVIGL